MTNKFDNTVKIGENVTIKPDVELHYVNIGNNVSIGKNTTIFGSKSHIVTIEDNTYISPNCYFNGAFGLFIGKSVTISAGVMIFSDSGPNIGPLKSVFPMESSVIIIENGCWIGAGSILLPRAYMKENSVLASNSTLKNSISSLEVHGGNPARYIKKIKLHSK
ncbi:MAG TPA: DapH/DapD/GlmU-related protein [Candidatus Woesebacteria bacterium]|nr:DapH/DapD/GlmU-related protein [Candidatus Woesebacteria bacterium]